jgi:hypothetical protein
VGDVDTLTQHLTALYEDRLLLGELREGALRAAPELTWSAAGLRLLDVYREVVDSHDGYRASEEVSPAGA